MITKRFNRIGKISKPYYTQNNEQVIDTELGEKRKAIETLIGGDEPYDVYKMISDQSKRIDVLESIIKKLDKNTFLEPRLDIGDALNVYNIVNERMKEISKLLDR